MLLGSVLCWVIFVPLLQHYMAQGGTIIGSQYKELINWTLWGGASCMVTAGLLSFALQWRSALRAFAGFGQMIFSRGRRSDTLYSGSRRLLLVVIGQVDGLNGMAYWPGDFSVPVCYGGGRHLSFAWRSSPAAHGRNRHHAGGAMGQITHSPSGHSPRQRERSR